MNGQPQWAGLLEFRVTNMGVTEPTPQAIRPFTIIPVNQPFRLNSGFEIGGWLGEGLNNLQVGGNSILEYNVIYFTERIGAGGGIQRSPAAIPCQPMNYTYGSPDTDLVVPANTLLPGTHRLTCVVKMSPAGGGSAGFPWHVTGFVEGPMIEIYQP